MQNSDPFWQLKSPRAWRGAMDPSSSTRRSHDAPLLMHAASSSSTGAAPTSLVAAPTSQPVQLTSRASDEACAESSLHIVSAMPSTAARLRRPAARQNWAVPSQSPVSSPHPAQDAQQSPLVRFASGDLPDSGLLPILREATPCNLEVTSGGGVPAARAIPTYLLTLDLCFAASFSVCAQWMTLGTAHNASTVNVVQFFLIFLPIGRLWDHANALFNRFDAEDIGARRRLTLALTLTLLLPDDSPRSNASSRARSLGGRNYADDGASRTPHTASLAASALLRRRAPSPLLRLSVRCGRACAGRRHDRHCQCARLLLRRARSSS
jgi:hypothetical protein